MPLLKRPSIVSMPDPSKDPGLIYLESQRFWAHRRAPDILRVQEFFASREGISNLFNRSKRYPLADNIELQPNFNRLDVSFMQTLQNRRTHRGFQEPNADREDLATLLMAAAGQHKNLPDGASGGEAHRRTFPSPGGLYATEIYFLNIKTAGLKPGLYHFRPDLGSLEVLHWEIPAMVLSEFFTDTELREGAEKAAGIFFFTSVFQRMRQKYGNRYLRFALLEVGCLCQNFELVASALKLRLWNQGSVDEGASRRLLKIDGIEESVVHASIFLGRQES